MPERPPDEPEYDWLYGKGGSRGGGEPPASDDPDPTRRIPVMPRHPAASGTPAPQRPEPRFEQPARPVTPAPPPAPPRAPRKRRSIKRKVLLVLALWVAYLIAVPVWAMSSLNKVDAAPAADRPADQPGTTYLLVGSDSRAGLSAEQRQELTTGDAAGKRTDTIMMLHTGSGPSTLISIPRDSLVPIPGHGTTKINAAYAFGGPKLLVQTVENTTGVRIDHYIEIGFGGFVNSVDAVGGIEICPDKAYQDRDSGLDVQAGCQTVDGIQALAWSRARHPFPTQDIARAEHQREVVGQIGSKVKSPWTVLNPIRYYRLNKAATTSLTVSEGTNAYHLGRFALGMTDVTGADGVTCSMPLADYAVHWDSKRALALMNLIKTDDTSSIKGSNLCTQNGLPR